MKYLIIGAGGTGGCIGGFLASAGKDVSFILRGKNLEYMKEYGLKLKTGVKGDIYLPEIKAVSEEEYNTSADVIFVCVKTYSMDEVIPLIKKASNKNTIIVPTANGFGIGNKLSEKLQGLQVLDGCIYISAYIEAPGTIVQRGNFFKLVFGQRKGQKIDPGILKDIKADLEQSGIVSILSENIERDTFKKFTFISTFAACGAYYDIASGDMQKPGVFRETFIELCREIENIGRRLNIGLDADITAENLKIVDNNTKDTTSSLQKDIKERKKSEIDGLIFEVARMAERLQVEAPVYKKIAEHFGYKA